MLKSGEDTTWMGEYYDYIRDGCAKEAYALLIGTLVCMKSVSCYRKPQGEVRSVGIHVDGECGFALMPTQKWLTFQWRPPVTRAQRYSADHVRSRFPDSFMLPQHEHWAVRIKTIEDALLLLLILDLS
ncbi:hypothetical protein ACIPZF_22290 [Pseudomonas sp. NPDC089752]|uniref:hypothetical protein n=1 Tax=Pseudomonas sp. NPDC089752 TaxID=3364472 RepID=UPI0037FF4729